METENQKKTRAILTSQARIAGKNGISKDELMATIREHHPGEDHEYLFKKLIFGTNTKKVDGKFVNVKELPPKKPRKKYERKKIDVPVNPAIPEGGQVIYDNATKAVIETEGEQKTVDLGGKVFRVVIVILPV